MTLSEKDTIYNWHPYTQHQLQCNFPAIVKGKDEFLWDENGQQYIDAIASWWVNPFGHANSFLAKSNLHTINNVRACIIWWFYT